MSVNMITTARYSVLLGDLDWLHHFSRLLLSILQTDVHNSEVSERLVWPSSQHGNSLRRFGVRCEEGEQHDDMVSRKGAGDVPDAMKRWDAERPERRAEEAISDPTRHCSTEHDDCAQPEAVHLRRVAPATSQNHAKFIESSDTWHIITDQFSVLKSNATASVKNQCKATCSYMLHRSN